MGCRIRLGGVGFVRKLPTIAESVHYDAYMQKDVPTI